MGSRILGDFLNENNESIQLLRWPTKIMFYSNPPKRCGEIGVNPMVIVVLLSNFLGVTIVDSMIYHTIPWINFRLKRQVRWVHMMSQKLDNHIYIYIYIELEYHAQNAEHVKWDVTLEIRWLRWDGSGSGWLWWSQRNQVSCGVGRLVSTYA